MNNSAEKTRIRMYGTGLTFATLLLLSLALSARATTLERMSLAQLTSASSAVVRVRCLEAASRWQGKEIWTYTRFETLETFRGSAPAQILVRVIGGRVGSIESVVDAAPRFRPGDEVILFLAKPLDGAYGLVAWTEGTFRVTRDAAGRTYVTQESSGEIVFDSLNHTFHREGIRSMPLKLFRRQLRNISTDAPASGFQPSLASVDGVRP